ncbi:MAG: 2-oxoisovalerate dehydrogenase [Saprospiraceae bacterium]|nr:2-oxoisovalerate dehydrogenase [Saprospiraceae bacterium]
MEEIIFIIKESDEGGYVAEALKYSIFTEAENWDTLKDNIKEAVHCHFDVISDKIIRLHFVKDEILALRNCPEIIQH